MATKSSPKKPTPTTSMTLEEFGESLDVPSLPGTVRELYVVRHHIARLDQRRKEVYAEVKVRFHRGTSVIPDAASGSGGYFLKESTTKVSHYRAVESAAVKKAYPKQWEAARTRQPWVQAKAPETYPVPELRGVKLPPAGAVLRTMDSTTLMRHYKSEAFSRIAELREEETALKEALEKAAASSAWDGEPVLTADQWAVGLWRLTFDSERFRHIDPEAFDRLAVDKTKGGVTRIDIVALDRAEEFGLVDLDGSELAE